MATLEALVISGIRGYNPDKLERIDFTHPLTLINGKNGSGKTTIIECLKFITTGEYPPSTSKQKSFVMDPQIAGRPEVRGDVRLRFRTAKNRVVIAKKILITSKTTKGLSCRAVEQSLKTKDENGKQIQMTHRCADIEKQLPQMLGISKAILENIVFCHQDQSLWPFADNSVLKNIFDQLFDTKRFTKTVENMKDALKQYEKQKLILKGELEYLKITYQKKLQYRVNALESLLQVVEETSQLRDVREKLKPLRELTKQKQSREEERNKINSSKGVLEFLVKESNSKIQAIRRKAAEQGVTLKQCSRQQKQQIVDRISQQIESKNKVINFLQQILNQTKGREALDKNLNEFQIEICRISQFITQLNDSEMPNAQKFQLVRNHFEQLNSKNKVLKKVQQNLKSLYVPTIPQEADKQSLKSRMSRSEKIKSELASLQNKIRLIYNSLYNPSISSESHNLKQSYKYAGDRIAALQAQIELKSSDLKKYQRMAPKSRSIEQDIYEIRYAGVQLQTEMLGYLEKKRKCMLCMKSVSDQELEDLKTKINKTVKKSEMRIAELKKKYTSSDQIDPAPLIAQIQSFLAAANTDMLRLKDEKQRYDKYLSQKRQLDLNTELNKIMQNLGFRSQMVDRKQQYPGNLQISIQNLKELASQYRNLHPQYSRQMEEIARVHERNKALEELKNKRRQMLEQKQRYQKELRILEQQTKNLPIIDNIYNRLEKLFELIKRQEQRGNNSEESSAQIQNKIRHQEKLLEDLKKELYQVNLSIELDEQNQKYYSLKHKLEDSKAKLQKINAISSKNTEIEAQKSALEIRQAQLSSIIELKRNLNLQAEETDRAYLQKLLRFNCITAMINDIHNAIKAMERATNRLHNEKMDLINKILYDIWQEVYNAKDIEFIKINSVAEKKSAGYGYSIMMKKNGQMIEMKGRCSMGQKVLASLIIRMALAEAFSASTHILALDEPTTNLDRAHIEKLADSISHILSMSQNSRLQLIIISHDMEFISLLRKHTNFYYEISRNQQNYSIIKRREISLLNKENPLERLEAIHY